MGCGGALFPWRTINGEEASAYYAAGTAQYHIDADIAYALDQYVRITGDTDLLSGTAPSSWWRRRACGRASGSSPSARVASSCINKVTGPDEYSTVVDNNLYTNLMAAENLALAADAVDRVRDGVTGSEYQRLVDRTGLTDDEVETWRRAADQIYVPVRRAGAVHLQDDNFLDLEPWDFPARHRTVTRCCCTTTHW